MSQTLTEIAKTLRDSNIKVQLIYAFNGVGKTRLSREFKELISPKTDSDEDAELEEINGVKILYYNAFTEDLFYWDNDLEFDTERKLKIHPNGFTDWVLKDQGQDQNIIANFQHYTNEKLTPHFNEEYTKNENGNEITVNANSEVTFSIERGNDKSSDNLKISKGEESNLIWSVFYTLLYLVIETLNIADEDERETEKFNQLEYIFIDDPVSSLDENHLIELAVDLAEQINSSYFSNDAAGLRFIITTHNPLFYNVLHNSLKRNKRGNKNLLKNYVLNKNEDETYALNNQGSDSPFSYHLYLKAELENAIKKGQLHKYHFNFLRNILEKTSTFLGYQNWGDLLPGADDGSSRAYESRIINISSHSKHSGEEVVDLTDDDKRVLRYLVKEINKMYRFKPNDG